MAGKLGPRNQRKFDFLKYETGISQIFSSPNSSNPFSGNSVQELGGTDLRLLDTVPRGSRSRKKLDWREEVKANNKFRDL